MTHVDAEAASQDLQNVSDEAMPPLRDAASHSGEHASKAIVRATERLRGDSRMVSATARRQFSAAVRDHPNAANVSSGVIFSLVAALVATFALLRLSQS